MTNMNQVNLTEKRYNFYFRLYSPIHALRCGNIYYNFYFRLYLPIHVGRCGNIYYIFGQVHHVNVSRCQLFGHVY